MNFWQIIGMLKATFIDGTRSTINFRSSGLYTISKPNGFVWFVSLLVVAGLCIYSIVSFKSGGAGFTTIYGITLGVCVFILALLHTYSRPLGYVLNVLGWLMFISCVGMLISDFAMGYKFSWGHGAIFQFFSQFGDIPENAYFVEDEGSRYKIITWLGVLISSFLFAYLGFKLFIPRDVEQKIDKVKDTIRQREAEQEQMAYVARQQQKEQESAQKRKAKGGYQACPNCGATNWNGKRLAIAECTRCKSYFCKTCAGGKHMGRVQTCPKCSSDSFKQKGFVEA